MPGFSKHRFVDLSNTEDDELTCAICLDIFNTPTVVQCCRQTYCHDCIIKWLGENQTCPNDRSPLTENALVEPPRLVQNMIAKLKIHCDYENMGCKTIVKLEDIIQHSLNCDYNPNNKNSKLCIDCGFTMSDEKQHNCILNLKVLNTSLIEENSRMREELEKFLNSQKLGIVNSIEQNAVLSASNWIKSKNGPKITDYKGFSNNMLKKVISIAREAIEFYYSFENISAHINKTLQITQNRYRWHVYVYTEKCGSSMVCSDFHYIDMSFGDVKIEIFSAGP